MEEGQIFQVKEKIGVFAPDEWLVLDHIITKHYNYYRVCLKNASVYQAIGILDDSVFRYGLEKGIIILKGSKKIKRKKESA